MSVLMKKPRTESVDILVQDRSNRVFRLPREKAKGLLTLIQDFEVMEDDLLVPSNEVFKKLHEKYGKAGTVIRGCRSRENMTQVELAKRLGIPQADVSLMETGKRSIGKKMAQRLADVFKTDYRIFL